MKVERAVPNINPYLGLILSAFLFLISISGSLRMVDETVVVPEYGYVEWPIQAYPGQAIRAVASVPTDDASEVTYGILELSIMDEKNFAHYESGDHGNIRERSNEWISTNSWDGIDVNIWWFGRVHVVLNNERALDRDASKASGIIIAILRPYGYLTIPSIVFISVSLVKSYRQYVKEFGRR